MRDFSSAFPRFGWAALTLTTLILITRLAALAEAVAALRDA
jgi:hypothetical protein